MTSLYEIIDAGLDPKDFLRRLSSRCRESLTASWDWRARPGQRWTPGKEFITSYECGRGFGKALALDTPLPTPTGWVPMGEIRVGDSLIDEQGIPCKVTGVFEVDAQESWRIHFSDHTFIDACGSHLWVTLNCLERKRINRRKLGIPSNWANKTPITTREMVKTLAHGKRGDKNHAIPLAQPLELPDRQFSVHPYVMGVWLGDGYSCGANVICHESDLGHYLERFAWHGETVDAVVTPKERPNIRVFRFGRQPESRGPDGRLQANGSATSRLDTLGVKDNKHIPPWYLRASKEQRLLLLQGLMDTDGHIALENGCAEYTSVNHDLALDVLELVRSLGQKPALYEGRATIDGKDCGPKWRICWRPTIPVVSLPRKVAALRPPGAQGMRNTHRMVVYAERLAPQLMRCVTVDSPHSMYLAGPGMIPTHNSSAGSEAICDASRDPERWGGYALIAAPSPNEVTNTCLLGQVGLFTVAAKRAAAGDIPGIRYQNFNTRRLEFENPRGGGPGLTVRWAASSDPKSFRGSQYGLAWLDEFGVWRHRLRDEQGTNGWEALQPSIRAGQDPKILITMTPSRVPEVRALQRDAERPECPTCRVRILDTVPDRRWRGDPGTEPWRIPRDPRGKVHPLLGTRTTSVQRTCPTCLTEIVARVRLVTGCSLDNPFLPTVQRSEATRALESGSPAARAEWDPQGESDAAPIGALVQDGDILRMDLPIADGHADRWRAVLEQLQAQEVVVFVDPAVSAGEHSDDSGVAVSCVRTATDAQGVAYRQVVGLEDATVRPEDVQGQGAPSTVWAPQAYWKALCWNANRIVVEVNQGGEEVLSAIKAALASPPTEQMIANRLAHELGRSVLQNGLPPLTVVARRMRMVALNLRVESVHRKASKPVRFGWYGSSAARREQGVAELPWLDGARHWQSAILQGTGFDPNASKGKDRKDRFDALVASAQVLMGVRETRGAIHAPSTPESVAGFYAGV